jgi:triosephosphate isomerase (TIM)
MWRSFKSILNNMNKKIIIANWKMNNSFDEAQIWVENLSQKLLGKNPQTLPEIVLCPPSIMIDYIDGLMIENEFEEIEKLHKDVEQIEERELEKLIASLRLIKLGGQDCHGQDQGAFTGEISAKMLKDCGGWYVILGHSERRQHCGESDAMVAEKIIAAVKQNLVPILCVGESKEQREQGVYRDFIVGQLQNSLPKYLKIPRLIVAYEPLWSIGSGVMPTITEIEEIADLIKAELSKNKNIAKLQINYGGSVNGENSGEILVAKNIDGLLVGGASLDAREFLKIISSC